MERRRIIGHCLLAFGLAGAFFVIAPVLSGPSAYLLAANTTRPSDAQLTAKIEHQLRGKHYRKITVQVNNGIAMLSGEADLYVYKAEAVQKARKTKGVQAVRDNIAVGGPVIPDAELQEKLLSRIQTDRVGYGQVFDAIGVAVKNGVVTLEGHALGPEAAASALSQAQFMPGVKGVIDRISIDPTSSNDDLIRMQAYHAIYGQPALRRYAVVPLKPIRISVQNGRVTLYGLVDSSMDKQLAYQAALTVPGVFHVTDNLIVQSQSGDHGNANKQ